MSPCYFENFLCITTNFVNCQVIPPPKFSIPKAGKIKEKEELKTMLKLGNYFLI